jgi:hypothetical protein
LQSARIFALKICRMACSNPLKGDNARLRANRLATAGRAPECLSPAQSIFCVFIHYL